MTSLIGQIWYSKSKYISVLIHWLIERNEITYDSLSIQITKEIFPICSKFSIWEYIHTRWNTFFQRIFPIILFSISRAYFYDMFVPFLWQKERLFTFLGIRHSIVSTERVEHHYNIHSGYFFHEKHGTVKKSSKRTTALSIKTKSFEKIFSVDRKMRQQHYPN